MKAFTKSFLRLGSELRNLEYDRRCKYGLGAVAAFPADMLWMKLVPNEDMVKDEWVPDGLSPEEQAQYRQHLVDRRTRYVTPLGTVVNGDTTAELVRLSTPDEARSVEELLFVYQEEHNSAKDVLKHLMRAHDWTLAEVERVVSGLAQRSEDEMGA